MISAPDKTAVVVTLHVGLTVFASASLCLLSIYYFDFLDSIYYF